MNEQALAIAIKIVKRFEGLSLRAYPDPASGLYKELSKHNMLDDYMQGKIELPDYLAELDGNPWTAMYGETQGVKMGDVYTQQEADSKLSERVEGFLQSVLEVSPNLATEAPERLAACTSLCYNIGESNYSHSTVAKCIANEDHEAAANAFGMWVKAHGQVLPGLVNRRKIESDLYRSARG